TQKFTAVGGKITEYHQRLFLQKQNSNDEDYTYILSDSGIITTKQTKPANFGNRRIAKAFRHFTKLIADEVLEIKENNSNITDIGALFQIVKKFEAAVMVGIEVDTNKDAYMLFESLNHRGVPLSALDLIKNSLIAQAENEADADYAYDQWKQILKDVGQDDYSVQERFFRQFYNAFRDELNAPYKSTDKKYYLGYLATRTTLIDIYEKMIKNDYSALLKNLSEKAVKYSIIVNNTEEEYVYTHSLQNLARISGAPSYLLLMYLLTNKEELDLSDKNIKDIVDTLIVFFVRRNLTDVPNTRKLTQLFIDIIAKIKLVRGNEIVLTVRDMLKDVSATDEMFEEKLRGPIYDDNPEATRFVLCNIEAQHQTKEIYSDLWSRDTSNKYVWTIEHIFPEGENIPVDWINMIANGDKLKAIQIRADYVHTLGNLTITGYNQHLSNMSFEHKKDRKSKDKTKDIGYRNGLFLNKDVVVENEWTVEKITKRTDELVKMLLDMYKW
ncbi:MAG: DUF1524 domain-containing protein, partial [Ruminococcus sp.]|nr:DUF1524 domain-containing protein [Ruminococcus sp.]